MFRKNWEWLSQYFSFYIHPDIIGKTKGKTQIPLFAIKMPFKKWEWQQLQGFQRPLL